MAELLSGSEDDQPDMVTAGQKPTAKLKSFNAMEGFATKPSRPKTVVDDVIPTKDRAVGGVGTLDPAASVESTSSDVSDQMPVIDDDKTSEAIEDIVISDSNELLAAQDAALEADSSEKRLKKSKKPWYKRLLKNKWLYLGLGIVLIAIFAWPYSRYAILGQFVKNKYSFRLTDSVTGSVISDAKLVINGQSLSTNNSGQASVILKLGKYGFKISKQYFQTYSGTIFVGLRQPKLHQVKLVATGRQVPIDVVNKLTGKPLAGATISVLGTNAKTNSNGLAYIVLPTSSSDYLATVSLTDYNSVTTRLIVTTNIKANSVSLVPSGAVYFLASSSGLLNVVKANLDGSDPQVELAGTGDENTLTTYLMASPDWKYLVLEAQRSGSQSELYVINTSNGNLNEFDGAADSFKLVGWSGDQFIYDEISSSEPTSTSGREQLKSYNAETQQLNVLDQDQVEGDSADYAYQSFYNFELLPDILVYNTQWNTSGSYDLSALSDTIRGVEPNGLNKKDYYTFAADNTGSIGVARYQPASLYFSVINTSNSQTTYYNYSSAAVTIDSSLSASSLSQTYPTYYLAPSGEQSLWTQTQNGQLSTFIGDQNGQNQKLVNLPVGYSTYGWFDNVYILLTKNSQLYMAPSTGSTKPVLVGSYQANPTGS